MDILNILPDLWGLIIEKLSVNDILTLRHTCSKMKNIIDKLRHPQFRKFGLLKVEKGCKTIMMGFWEELGVDQEDIIKEYNSLHELPSISVMSSDYLYKKLVWNCIMVRYEWMTEKHRKLATFAYDATWDMHCC